MKYLAIFLLFLSFSNTNSCNKSHNVLIKKEDIKNQSTQKTKFFITTLNEKNISEEKLYIIFDEVLSSVSGFSGCNKFISKHTTQENNITFEYPRATKMYCKKSAALEKEFFKTLSEVKIKILKGDTLILKDNNKELFFGIRSRE